MINKNHFLTIPYADKQKERKFTIIFYGFLNYFGLKDLYVFFNSLIFILV